MINLSNLQPHVLTAVFSILAGIVIEKYRNKKPNILYYLSSMSDYHIPAVNSNQKATDIYTHSIILVGQQPQV